MTRIVNTPAIIANQTLTAERVSVANVPTVPKMVSKCLFMVQGVTVKSSKVKVASPGPRIDTPFQVGATNNRRVQPPVGDRPIVCENRL